MDDLKDLIREYCQSSDEVSFRRFYRHESRRLWRYLVARGATEAQAYDLVSEAFIRFLKSVCKNPESPSALLFRIAQNLLIDQFRHGSSREIPLESSELVPSQVSSPDLDSSQDLLQAIKKLNRDEQNILLLRYWLGMTYKEVAEVIGRPEGTLRRQGAAALRQLKQLMNDYEQH
jgi:RNA polymerase sigma-70 factor (ECF subfamily)